MTAEAAEAPTRLRRPKASLITSAVEAIGPKEARYLLRQNQRNRRVSAPHVTTMVRDMKAGKWDLNGETIKVGTDGELLDGQHRMLAVIESGATVAMVVVRGLPTGAQDTIDSGKPRGMKDVFDLHGEASAAALAAVLRFTWLMELTGRPRGGGTGVNPSHQDLIEYYDQNPEIRQSVLVGSNANKSAVHYPTSAAGGLHYLMSRIDAPQADQFWSSLMSGENLSSRSPIWKLREQLLKELGAAHRVAVDYRVAVTIKAWNFDRSGKEIGVLVWKRGVEDYPTLG